LRAIAQTQSNNEYLNLTEQLINEAFSNASYGTLPSNLTNIHSMIQNIDENMINAQIDSIKQCTSFQEPEIIGSNESEFEHHDSVSLNQEKQAAFKYCTDWYKKKECFQFDKANSIEPDQLLLFIHGGPGTVKSTLSNEITKNFTQSTYLSAAKNGIAASLLNRGQTLDSLMGNSFGKKKI
jgi:hypothetical protein